MGKIIAIVGLAISIGALLFCGIGYGAPWWVEVGSGIGAASSGLFQFCVKDADDKWICDKVDTKSWGEWVYAYYL